MPEYPNWYSTHSGMRKKKSGEIDLRRTKSRIFLYLTSLLGVILTYGGGGREALASSECKIDLTDFVFLTEL
jgi:hypothetical protein